MQFASQSHILRWIGDLPYRSHFATRTKIRHATSRMLDFNPLRLLGSQVLEVGSFADILIEIVSKHSPSF